MSLLQRFHVSQTTGVLDVSNMELHFLPDLPDSIRELRCSHNSLTSLPPLPASLHILRCANNSLTSLPELPDSLVILCCDQNKLVSLPNLPDSLLELDCSMNDIHTLQKLPTSLTELYCEWNQLTTLPNLPKPLTKLYCYDNPFRGKFAEMTSSAEGMIPTIRQYYARKKQARETLAFQQTLGRSDMSDDCNAVIGSYLSAYNGTLPNQFAKLRECILP